MLETVNFCSKTVLLRLDLNVPFTDTNEVADSFRIEKALKTLLHLKKQKAKVVILAHRGRPKKGDKTLTLKPLVDAIKKLIPDLSLAFCPESIGGLRQQYQENLKDGAMLLCENVRFHDEEYSNDQAFAKELASGCDFYINDAFACSHRAHASVCRVTQFLKSFKGFQMQKELAWVATLLANKQLKAKTLALIGGAKISSKLSLIENLSAKVGEIVVVGAMANTVFKAQGYNMGRSLVEDDMQAMALTLLETAKKNGCQITLPHDLRVVKEVRAGAEVRTVSLDGLKDDDIVVDAGPKTAMSLATLLTKYERVIWNGALGIAEIDDFSHATHAAAKEVAKLTADGKLESYAGGGDTVSTLRAMGYADKFTALSTGGGAFLEAIEGKKLPGVIVLE